MMIPLGIVLGALVAFIIFGRRAQKSVYSKAEGQTGAAAWALENLRGKWRVTPGVAATGHFDAVHRVIGRPGVILVGEGSPTRVKPLLAQEKKRTARLVGDIPDLRHHGRQRRGRGAAGQAGAAPDQAARQHHRQADGLAGVAAGRAGHPAGAAAMPKGPMPRGAKMRNVQRTVRRTLSASRSAALAGPALRSPIA